MSTLRTLFPLSFGIGDVASLIVKILIYLVLGAVAGFLIGIVGAIPVIGLVAGLAGWLVELYILAGVIIAVLSFLKILN